MTERAAPLGGIVLAGGRSSRFGRDKLAEPIDGRPLLHHAIGAVQAVADDVVVVVGPDLDPFLPEGVRLVHDAAAFEGPLAGLAAGLDAMDPVVEHVVVVGGDMPTLQPTVLWRLIAALGGSIDLALLELQGEAVPLPMAVRRTAAIAAVRGLLDDDERRLRALPAVLRTSVVAEVTWQRDDPDGATLRDVDTPADVPAGPD